jgi:drug/metabolite transporter (DMT)-like permease
MASMRQQHQTAPPLEIGLLLLLGILWGMPYALTKIALVTIPPITMVAARVTLAAAALWVVMLVTGRKTPVSPGIAARLFVQGVLGCAIPYTLIAFGQRSVDSALTSILNSTGPLFVCLISLAWTRQEVLTAGRVFGVAVGLGGVVMITGAGAFAGLGESAAGPSAILLATLSSAFSVIHARRFIAVAPEVVAAGTLTSAGLVLIPLCLLVEAPLNSTPSAAALAALATNAIIATALGFVVYFRLIRTVGSIGTASVGYLRPGIGVLIGCVLMGEPLTWTIASGLIVILVSVAAINRAATWPATGSIAASLQRPPDGTAVLAERT